jgi:hypothetical protein
MGNCREKEAKVLRGPYSQVSKSYFYMACQFNALSRENAYIRSSYRHKSLGE